MTELVTGTVSRRVLLAGASAAAVLALPGCASLGGFSLVDAVRRLLTLSTQNAFARLTQNDGFWNSAVARIGLPTLFGKRGTIIEGILGSTAFRDQLQKRLNNIAESGARAAAPVVAEAVRNIGIDNAVAIIKGEPTAATSFLRASMGPGIINAMIPAIGDAMRVANDPIIGQALSALTGVKLGDAAHALALEADNAIWYEIGASEADIRANPEKTNDALLIAALTGAKTL